MSHAAVALHDPTHEAAPAARARLAPPPSLDGKTVGLFDIGKSRAGEFLDYLEDALQDRGLRTRRFAKPTNAKPASPAILAEIAEHADVVAEGLAD